MADAKMFDADAPEALDMALAPHGLHRQAEGTPGGGVASPECVCHVCVRGWGGPTEGRRGAAVGGWVDG